MSRNKREESFLPPTTLHFFSKNVSLELTLWRTRSWEKVQIALMVTSLDLPLKLQ